MKNKRAGFWIRLLARLIDLLIVSVLSISFALIDLRYTHNWYFENDWFFYIWILFNVLVLIVVYLLTPIIWDGKTVGMWICRIKILFEDNNKFVSILKRELFISVSWIILFVCVGVFINHTLFDRYARTSQDHINYTTWEMIRISTITTIASLLTVAQMITAISIVIRKPKKSLHDSYSKTDTVWINKMVKVLKVKKNVSIKPRLIKQEEVEWI